MTKPANPRVLFRVLAESSTNSLDSHAAMLARLPLAQTDSTVVVAGRKDWEESSPNVHRLRRPGPRDGLGQRTRWKLAEGRRRRAEEGIEGLGEVVHREIAAMQFEMLRQFHLQSVCGGNKRFCVDVDRGAAAKIFGRRTGLPTTHARTQG